MFTIIIIIIIFYNYCKQTLYFGNKPSLVLVYHITYCNTSHYIYVNYHAITTTSFITIMFITI